MIQILKKTISVLTIITLASIFLFPEFETLYWDLSLYAVIILMIMRPLDDIMPSLNLRPYMSLRKELGIFSASIVVLFGIITYVSLGTQFIPTYFSLEHWNIFTIVFWAHLGELTGFILLITSNKKSMILLKRNWKRVQKLSYVYFFSGSWFVFQAFGKTVALAGIIIVFQLTIIAYLYKKIPEPKKHDTTNY